ncbi:MAG TPA: tyrosine-type recombinase/integrase [Candidatus Angelobacter sp.]
MVRRKKLKRSKAKTIFRLPDLEQSKNAVLHSLAAPSSHESYGHAIDEFIGCGLRRAELVGLETEDFQIREEHWVIADLIGKGKHIRTVPVPAWAKRAVDDWITAAGITSGAIFRRVSRLDKIWGDGITPKAIWHVVKGAAKRGYHEPCSP